MLRAYNGRLSSTLSTVLRRNVIFHTQLEHAIHYSVVPRFNTRFMKDSIANRGSVLWNMMSTRYTDLFDTSHYNLAKKLETSELFKAIKFNVLSVSTASFELEDFETN